MISPRYKGRGERVEILPARTNNITGGGCYEHDEIRWEGAFALTGLTATEDAETCWKLTAW